ncbi:MAG: hypothetical protein CL908_06535 [Deltaproteobacteria bacterium]|nr:hypothetical protein [Deltaproteobacteria bacterium]
MEAIDSRRTYDYRIQEAICETGDRDLFPELNFPRSTIRSLTHRGVPDVITCDPRSRLSTQRAFYASSKSPLTECKLLFE